MSNNFKLALITLIVGALGIAGCKKSNNSIVGTWTENNDREIDYISGTQVRDTTTHYTSATATVITFQSNGYYNGNDPGYGTYGGKYAYTGGTLTFFDSTGAYDGSATVTVLNSNTLTVQSLDSNYNSNNALVVEKDLDTYTR